jgi:hypothetical protein
MARSAAPSAGLSAGFFCKVAAVRAASAGGTFGLSSVTSGGGSWRCMFATASEFSASKGSAPVSIRKRVTPKA